MASLRRLRARARCGDFHGPDANNCGDGSLRWGSRFETVDSGVSETAGRDARLGLGEGVLLGRGGKEETVVPEELDALKFGRSGILLSFS